MPKLDTILRKLDVQPTAATIYLCLLASGQGTVSQIAHASKLHRPAIYRHLPELLEKGLVSQANAGKRTLYVAESPARLANLMKRFNEELDAALPELVARYEHRKAQPMIRYFQGPEGIRAVYEDLLQTIKKGDVVYRYDSPEDYKNYSKYKPSDYKKRIIDQKEVDWLIITNETTRVRKTPRLERSLKAVPGDQAGFMYDISQLIYGKKVAFIDYRQEVASIIESSTFAGFQRKIFKLLFDRL